MKRLAPGSSTMRAPGIRALVYQFIYFLEATVLARHLKARGVRGETLEDYLTENYSNGGEEPSA